MLPTQILSEIFLYLSGYFTKQITLTCKLFNEIVNTQYFFEQRIKRLIVSPSKYKRLLKKIFVTKSNTQLSNKYVSILLEILKRQPHLINEEIQTKKSRKLTLKDVVLEIDSLLLVEKIPEKEVISQELEERCFSIKTLFINHSDEFIRILLEHYKLSDSIKDQLLNHIYTKRQELTKKLIKERKLDKIEVFEIIKKAKCEAIAILLERYFDTFDEKDIHLIFEEIAKRYNGIDKYDKEENVKIFKYVYNFFVDKGKVPKGYRITPALYSR